MLLSFFDDVLDKIYYGLTPYAVYISIGAFILAALCLVKIIRKKNDKHPIAWGWFILSIIFLGICIAYSFLAGNNL